MNSNDLISVTKDDLVAAFRLWAEDFRENPEDYKGASSADLDLTDYSVGAADDLINHIAVVQAKFKGE